MASARAASSMNDFSYPSAPYFGSAHHMAESDWMKLNAVTLRSNWRDLLDYLVETGDEATLAEVRDFDVWARCEYELESYR